MKLVLLAVLAAFNVNAADTLAIWGRAWAVPAATDWKVEEGTLRLETSRGPLPGPRRPIQFALTDVPNYQRLAVEADVMPLGRSLLIVLAYRDPAHFDYAHLSTDTAGEQPVHNGVFTFMAASACASAPSADRQHSRRGAVGITSRWHMIRPPEPSKLQSTGSPCRPCTQWTSVLDPAKLVWVRLMKRPSSRT